MTHPLRFRFELGFCCVAAALTPVVIVPVPARANHFDVSSCHANQGTYLNPGGSGAAFAGFTHTTGGYYTDFDQCANPNTGLGATSYSGYDSAAGNFAAQRFQAPPGDQIERVQVWRSIFDFGRGRGGTSQRAYVGAMADGAPVGEFFDGSADVAYGAAGTFDHTNNGINAGNYLNIDLTSRLPTVFGYQLGCQDLSPCPTGGNNPMVAGGSDTQVQLYGAVVSVRDNSPPTATLDRSGLLGPGKQTGTVPLTLSASDEAGIGGLEIYAAGRGGAPAITEDFTHTSACSFWLASPCQNLTAYHDPIDTSRLPNGTYYLIVKVYDPAGNPVTVTSPAPITVANVPPPGPGRPTGASANGQVHLAITQHRALRVRFGRRAVIRGRLTAAKGTPIAHAVFDVFGQVQHPGAPFVLLGHTTTTAHGTYHFRLAPGPSRIIQVSYDGADRASAAQRDVVEHVRAGATLAIRPAHVRNRQRITFTGRLLGAFIPAGGKGVEIQVRVGRRWRDVVAAHANARGRFRATYRFQRSAGVTYRFRAIVRPEPGYPYIVGASRPARVRVG